MTVIDDIPCTEIPNDLMECNSISDHCKWMLMYILVHANEKINTENLFIHMKNHVKTKKRMKEIILEAKTSKYSSYTENI